MRRNGLPKWCSEFQDRHGRWRVRARRKGWPTHYFKAGPGTDEFGEEYRRWMASEEPVPVGASRTKPGSISALLVEYYASAKWAALADASKEVYRRIYERFRADHGDKPVARLEPIHVERILDRMAETPAAANLLRKRLNTLMKFAVKRGYRKDNPVEGVDAVPVVVRGYRTWTEADINAFRRRWAAGTPQRLAMEILLFTGLRRGDAVKLGRQHVSGEHFIVRTSKSRGRTRLEIPIHPTLRRHLEYAPKDGLTFIVTEKGKPRSDKAFTGWFREAAHKAGLPPDSSPHGLRKAACTRLAEAGCTPHQIMAITGHKNLSEVENYTNTIGSNY